MNTRKSTTQEIEKNLPPLTMMAKDDWLEPETIKALADWFCSRGLLTQEVASACTRVADASTLAELCDYLREIQWEMGRVEVGPEYQSQTCVELSGYVAKMVGPVGPANDTSNGHVSPHTELVPPSAADDVDAEDTSVEAVESSDAPGSAGSTKNTPSATSGPANGVTSPPATPARTSRAIASTLPVGELDERDPKSLDEHRLLRRLFDLGTDDANAELLESVRGRQYRPIVVTGSACESAPNTVLDGRRLRRAALRLGVPVRVEVLDGLTAEMEAKIVIHANVASGLARRHDEQAKAALESYYIQTYGKKQGERTDLTSVQSHGGDHRETPQIVADKIREEFGDDADVTPTALRERQLIFYDPVSPEMLKRAVKTEKIARRPAADLVRDAHKDPEVAALIREARLNGTAPDVLENNAVIAAAKKKLFAEVEKKLGKKPPPPPKAPKKTEASAAVVEGFASISNFLGRKVVVQFVDGKVLLKDMGAAETDPSTYVASAPTTRLTWPVDVAAVAAELSEELDISIAAGEPEVLEPVHCPKCRETRFYAGGGGCVRCEPFRVWLVQNLQHPRTRIRIATPAGEIPIVQWEREADVLPNGGFRDTPCVSIPHSVVPIYLSGRQQTSRRQLREKVREAITQTLKKAENGSRTSAAGGGHPSQVPEDEPAATPLPPFLA